MINDDSPAMPATRLGTWALKGPRFFVVWRVRSTPPNATAKWCRHRSSWVRNLARPSQREGANDERASCFPLGVPAVVIHLNFSVKHRSSTCERKGQPVVKMESKVS